MYIGLQCENRGGV